MSEIQRRILSSKIHNAKITEACLDYQGSISIPESLMNLANIIENEAVWVWNLTRGTRLETYTIKGDEGEICINGAASHLMKPGDRVIIASFINVPESKILSHLPRIIFVDGNNQPISIEKAEKSKTIAP